MKRILALLLCAAALIGLCACSPTVEPDPIEQGETPVQRAEEWLTERIEKNSFFSFTYEGKALSDFIRSWEKKVETGESDKGHKTWTLTYRSPEQVSLRFEIDLDPERAAIEYTGYFKNEASGDSPVIADILPLDATLTLHDPVLTTAEGSKPTDQDFAPIECDLAKKGSFSTKNNGGRSSSTAFPYFDLTNADQTGGLVGAIGWTGDWKLDAAYENSTVSLKAGMVETRISLHGEEEMRTPAILLIFFDGDRDTGHNALRRVIYHSYTPIDPETQKPLAHAPLSMARMGNVYCSAIMQDVRDYVDSGYTEWDTFLLDAGWYGSDAALADSNGWAHEVGNWYVNKTLWPDDFVPFVNLVHENGKKFILWFEPERVIRNTDLATTHPEYLLPEVTNADFRLYNMANDEAMEYMANWVAGVLIDNDIDWYRQDFNRDPAEHWKLNDSLDGENRVGMTEIKYITNEYRYLDLLVEKKPGLLIDNCASGGKRLDFEMMRRSIPLWRTDYSTITSTSDGVRNIAYNLCWWLPISSGGSSSGLATTYDWRSAQGSGMNFNGALMNKSWMQPLLDQYLRCRELMNDEFYILASGEGVHYASENAVYEFYDTSRGEGYLMIFRPEGSKTEKAVYPLKGLEKEASYRVENADTGESFEATGALLMDNGIEVLMDTPKTSTLLYLTKQA